MMRARVRAVVITASLLVGVTGWAGETNSVQKVSVTEQQDASVVVIHTRSTPTFNVFKLANPPRIFVDVSSIRTNSLPGSITVDNGVISRIGVVQFLSAGQAQTRVVITLVRDVPYTVRTQGTDILVKLSALYRHENVNTLRSRMQGIREELQKAKAKAARLSEQLGNAKKLKELQNLIKQEQERRLALQEAAKKEEERLKYLKASQQALLEKQSTEKRILSIKAEKSSARNRKLLAELKQLAAQKAQQSQQLEALAAQVRQEEDMLRRKARERKAQEAKLAALVKKGNSALKNYVKAQRQVARLQAQLADTRGKLAKARAELQRTKAEHARLSRQVQNLQAQVQGLQKKKGTLTQLTRQLRQVSREASVLKQRLAQKEAALQRAPKGQDIRKLKAALARTRRQYEAKIAQLNALAAQRAREVQRLQARVQDLQQAKGNLTQLTRQLQQVSREASVLRKRLAQKEAALQRAPKGRDIQQLKAALARTRQQYEAKIAQLNALATQKAREVRRLSVALQDLKNTKSSQTQALEALKKRLHEREQEIEVMRQAIRNAGLHGKKTRSQKREITQLRRDLKSYVQQTRELNRKYKSLLARENMLRSKREKRIRELTRQLEILQRQVAQRKSVEVEKLRKAISRKEAEIRRLRANQAGKQALQAQQAKLKALKRSLKQASVREQQARQREAQAAAKVVSLMDKLVKAEGELAAMKEKVHATTQRLNQLTMENRQSKRRIAELQQQLSQAQAQNKGEVARLQKELEAEKQKRRALERKQARAMEELRRTRRMMARKQAQAKGIEQNYKVRKGLVCTIRKVAFEQGRSAGMIRLSIKGVPDYTVTRLGPKTLLMTIRRASIDPSLEKKMDVSAFDTPVKQVTIYSDGKGNVKLLLEGKIAVRDRLDELSGLIVWNVLPDESGNMVAQVGQTGVAPSGYKVPNAIRTAQTGQTISPTYLKPFVVPKRKRFRGKRINLTVKDADIVNVLTFLAKEGHVNIVTTKGVRGRVSFHLENVPWDQALDTILKVNGLDYVVEQGIYRVAPAQQIQAEYQREMEKRKRARALKPVMIRLIPVNYTRAQDLAGKVKSLLSKRGSVSFDKRTNTLIIKDTEDHLVAIESLVHKLDMQTPQVLIEARIVEARTSFTRSMGIQWGGKFVMAPGYGNDTGLVFPNTIGIGGGADDKSAPLGGLFNDSPHFAVNLPAPAGMGSGGALGITLGSLGGAANLSLRLSSAEENGDVKIISAPRISTLDNEKAVISQGVSIPISVVSAAGVNTQFFSADLKLQVTPHVTRDGHILLKIFISKNEPDFGNMAANGNPTIQKKEAQTELLVNDGDTAVIGGIYTKNTSKSYHKLPFFGDIPILGWLFKTKSSKDDRSELLIFITPKVVNREVNL